MHDDVTTGSTSYNPHFMNSIILRHLPQRRQHMVRTKQYLHTAVTFPFQNPSSLLLLLVVTPITAFHSSPPQQQQKHRFISTVSSTTTSDPNISSTIANLDQNNPMLHTTMTPDCACCPTKSKSSFDPLSPPTIPVSQQPIQEPNNSNKGTSDILMSATTTCSQSAVIMPASETTTATESGPTIPKNTFYRRSLPSTCVAFSSKLGRKYFESAMRNRGLKSYFHLMEQYTTQSEPAFCGISTLVIALNALAVDPRQIWKGSWRWYEESMLNCCFDLEQAKITGITMPMFNCLALCQGLSMETHYVDECEAHVATSKSGGDKKLSSVEKFRELVKEACIESHHDIVEGDESGSNNEENESHRDMSVDRVLIASYARRTLQQTGSGHFSPIAAYDEESDTVLIMDTARFKYGAHWVKLPLLYEAMQPIDPDTSRSRGYMMLIHPKDDADSSDATKQHRLPNLPIAVLLRSEMKQSDVRRTFKDYWVNLKKRPSYDDIARFFHRKGSYLSIWDMVLPQLRPYDNDIATKTIVEELRSLTGYILSSVKVSRNEKIDEQQVDDSSHCRANHCRTIQLRTEEAIMVVYLACLEVQERERIIFDPAFQNSTTEQARLQLLAEAELVRYAVDTSDQLPSTAIHSATT